MTDIFNPCKLVLLLLLKTIISVSVGRERRKMTWLNNKANAPKRKTNALRLFFVTFIKVV